MKAIFIHFWCVESEFIIKNKFHNWTSELGCIWRIHFWKLRLLLALFECSSTGSIWCCQDWSVWKESKRVQVSKKKSQMHPNSDVQLWNWFLTINSDSTHQKWMKFASIVTGSIFLQSHQVSELWRNLIRKPASWLHLLAIISSSSSPYNTIPHDSLLSITCIMKRSSR